MCCIELRCINNAICYNKCCLLVSSVGYAVEPWVAWVLVVVVEPGLCGLLREWLRGCLYLWLSRECVGGCVCACVGDCAGG